MKVRKEERILKETALEALELALQQNGLARRPKRGKQGWAAIEQVMVWWKGEGWPSLSKEQQDEDLRTATVWRTYRVGKAKPMSEDVDEVRLAEWAALLSELLRSKEGVATVGAPSNIQPSPPPPLPPAPSQLPPPLEAKVDSAPEPPPAPPPPPVAPPLLSFSGSASSMLSALWASGVREDAAMAAALDCATFTPKPPPPQPVTAAAAEPTKVVPPPFPSSAAPWIPGSTRQKRPGGPSTLLKGQAVLHRPAHGRAHVDFISPDGELVCSAAVRRKASAPLAVASLRVNEDPGAWASAADRAAVTAAGVGVGATSAVGAETLTTAQSVAPEGSRARTASEEASCDCTRCEMQVFRAGTEVGKRRLESTSSLSTSPGQPLVVRHLNHHDSLIPTNEAGTEFKLHCGLLRRKKSSSSVTSSVFSDFVSEAQARGGPTRDGSARSSELTSSCSCCDGSGGGGGDGSSRGDGDDSDKFSKEHELFRLLDEDEVDRLMMDDALEDMLDLDISASGGGSSDMPLAPPSASDSGVVHI